MKNILTAAAAATFAGVLLAACGGGGSGSTSLPQRVTSSPSPAPVGTNAATFTQIERLARPAVKELTETFVNHQISNAAEPYNDPTLQSSISGFIDAVRPPLPASSANPSGVDYGATLATILYPDEFTVNLASASTAASYLGVETGGATGGTFGGRAITDNVIDISLGAVFGNTLSALKVLPDDGEENNCLTSQHVSLDATQTPGTTFPYLAVPH